MRIIKRRLTYGNLLLVACLLCVSSAHGQPATGLTGVVFDRSGAVVPGASVKLFSPQKERETRTSASGRFDFPDLPAGTYELEITEPGFKTFTEQGLRSGDEIVQPLAVTLELDMSGHCLGDERAGPEIRFEKRSNKSLALRGTVRSFRDGTVSGATLTLVGQQTQTAISNAKGGFEFFNVEPGKYTLKVAHEGYFDSSGTTFWITRDDLTRITIDIFRTKGPLPCSSVTVRS